MSNQHINSIAFIEYDNEESAAKAKRDMDNQDLDRRPIKVMVILYLDHSYIISLLKSTITREISILAGQDLSIMIIIQEVVMMIEIKIILIEEVIEEIEMIEGTEGIEEIEEIGGTEVVDMKGVIEDMMIIIRVHLRGKTTKGHHRVLIKRNDTILRVMGIKGILG
jgi:RNA recognition motif. (a.k.a. RRM, RBD, or RNP domain)